MTERDPIIVQTERRTMSVELTDSERGERSQRVHVEIAARIEEEAKQATLEAEAKAKREDAKSAAERVAQRQIQINRLSEAARTGRETRQVDVVFSYDPTCGEVVGRREDTGEEVERRKPDRAAEAVASAVRKGEPLPVVPAPGETLTLDRLLRTAVQVACSESGAALLSYGEDRAIERVQALLTPAGRLALAAELLEPLGLVDVTMTSASFAALTAGRVVHERIDGHEYHRHATLLLGKVRVHVGETRPATLDDARRLLEGEG